MFLTSTDISSTSEAFVDTSLSLYKSIGKFSMVSIKSVFLECNMYITTTLIGKYFDSTMFVDALFSFRSSLARLVIKCDIQISYEMVSNAYVHQLTVFL